MECNALPRGMLTMMKIIRPLKKENFEMNFYMFLAIQDIHYHNKLHTNGNKTVGSSLLAKASPKIREVGWGILFRSFEITFSLSLAILDTFQYRISHQ